jgi:uncharacterized protein (TIGR03435 family)
MLQSLLADRFQLKLHRDSKDLSIYNLVLGKSGLKVKPAPPDTPAVRPAPPLQRSSIEQLDAMISVGLDRPLIDKTGLAGDLEYPIDWSHLDMTRAADRATDSESVEEQLGLKLESTKAQIEILVIDHAEKPSAN